MQSQKWQNDLCSFPRQTIQSTPQSVTLKKLKLTVQWRPTRPSRTNTQKRCPFHYRGLKCKSRKSRNTWGNRQIWPWSTEWSRAKANRGLPRERTGHSKHPLPTTQEKTLHMDITRSSTLKSDWLYSLQPKMELYKVSKNKKTKQNKTNSQQKQDREQTVTQIMKNLLPNSDLNWRKWGKPLEHSGMTEIRSPMTVQRKYVIDWRD